MEPYAWSAVDQFRGRELDLARLETWWQTPRSLPLNLFGRRRVGKSWLLRRFAHGKPAVLLVAEQSTPTQQLARLVDQLAPYLPFRPEVSDLGELVALVHRMAPDEPTLVVIDEFPYLLGSTADDVRRNLSAVQAALERHRDDSQVRLVVCGSAVAQMEALQAERSPLHGRLQPYSLAPLDFPDARSFLTGLPPTEQLARYAVAGGMPRYLSALAGPSLPHLLAREVVDRNAPLFHEPLAVLQAEVREPATYLGILRAMAHKPADSAALSASSGVEARALSPYLERLEAMGLVRRRRPVGADPRARSTQYECADALMRFWFRFVQPFVADLEGGADPLAHVREHVLPELADHTAPVFEEQLRRWTRQAYPGASLVGAWWGPALHTERRARRRSTEEIDTVGLKGDRIVVVAEATWTRKPLSYDVLRDLVELKVPALEQAGRTGGGTAGIVLASRSGFTAELTRAAASDPRVHLLNADTLLTEVR